MNTPHVRALLVAEQNGRCYLCGVLMDEYDPANHHAPRGASIDHVVPRIHGGTNERSNLAAACHSCNQSKAGLLPLDLTTPAGRDRALGLHTFLAHMATCTPLRRIHS